MTGVCAVATTKCLWVVRGVKPLTFQVVLAGSVK